jgi:hypothetical protein
MEDRLIVDDDDDDDGHKLAASWMAGDHPLLHCYGTGYYESFGGCGKGHSMHRSN